MAYSALVIRPGRRLVVELDLPGVVDAGYRVWLEVRDLDGRRQLAGEMTTSDRDLWRVEFPGTATADVTADGSFEAVVYTAGTDDADQVAAGVALVRPAVAVTGA